MQNFTLPSDYSSASTSLAGRSILITGAGGGLGGELARRSAQLGATVVLAGRTVAKLEQVYDAIAECACPQPAIYPIDFSGATSEDYDTLAETLRSELGGVDAIVHCAAATGPMTPLSQYPVKDWLQTLHVNLTAPMLLTRSCLKVARAETKVSVVFTHDDKARAYWGAYGVAKSGLLGLVKMFAEEFEHKTLDNGERQFSINAVLPGPIGPLPLILFR